jgi:hypothetical protein
MRTALNYTLQLDLVMCRCTPINGSCLEFFVSGALLGSYCTAIREISSGPAFSTAPQPRFSHPFHTCSYTPHTSLGTKYPSLYYNTNLVYMNTQVFKFWAKHKRKYNISVTAQECFSTTMDSVYQHCLHDLCAFKILLVNTLTWES